MKRIIIILMMIAVMAGEVWAATYYVSLSGSNTSPYDTWAKAANLPSTVLALNPAGGPHTVYIAAGDYTTEFSVGNAAWNSAQFIGTSAHGSTSAAAKGQVRFLTANGIILSGPSGITMSNLSVTSSGATRNIYIDSDDVTLNNMYAYDAASLSFYISGSVNVVINDSLFEGSGASDAFDIRCPVTFNYCVIRNSETKDMGTSSAVRNVGSGLATFNNCIIGGSASTAARNTSAGILTINNSILQGGYAGGATVAQTAGTVNLTNNIILPSVKTTRTATSGTIAVNTGTVTDKPLWNSHRTIAYIIPAVDDATNLAYAQSLEAVLASRGMKGTYYIQGKDAAANSAALQAMNTAGTITIAAHSYSHGDVTATGGLWSITKAGHTINVDRAGNQIVVSGAAPVTVTGFKTKTITAIRTELTAGGCTNGALVATIQDTTLGEIMADSAGAQASPYTPQILVDNTAATGIFNVEIAQAKSLIESAVGSGYAVKSYAFPSGVTNADARTALAASGYLGGRGNTTMARANWFLGAINTYYITTLDFSTAIKGTTDAETIAHSKAFCEWVSEHGAIVSVIAHTTSDATMAQWGLFLDVAQAYSNISITSDAVALNAIRTSGDWATTDNVTWTRSLADSSDYRLQWNSPAKNAGVLVTGVHDVAGVTDYAGNSVYNRGGIDIGAYEYMENQTLGSGPAVTIGAGPAITLN